MDASGLFTLKTALAWSKAWKAGFLLKKFQYQLASDRRMIGRHASASMNVRSMIEILTSRHEQELPARTVRLVGQAEQQ